MDGVWPCPPVPSTWTIQVLNYHSLAIKPGHFLEDKKAYSLSIQFEKLPLGLDSQPAWLKIKQGCQVHLAALIPPAKLLYPTLGLPNVVIP